MCVCVCVSLYIHNSAFDKNMWCNSVGYRWTSSMKYVSFFVTSCLE